MTNQDKYKEYRKDYYKQHYQKNKQYYTNYNKNRPSTRTNFTGIDINGTIYCFPSKSKIRYIKVKKSDINNDNIKLVCV